MPLSQQTAVTSAVWEVPATVFLPGFLPHVEGVKEPALQTHFGHGGWDETISDALPSVGHSPFFTGCFQVLHGNT